MLHVVFWNYLRHAVSFYKFQLVSQGVTFEEFLGKKIYHPFI